MANIKKFEQYIKEQYEVYSDIEDVLEDDSNIIDDVYSSKPAVKPVTKPGTKPGTGSPFKKPSVSPKPKAGFPFEEPSEAEIEASKKDEFRVDISGSQEEKDRVNVEQMKRGEEMTKKEEKDFLEDDEEAKKDYLDRKLEELGL